MNNQQLREYIKKTVKEVTVYKKASDAAQDTTLDPQTKDTISKMSSTDKNKPIVIKEIENNIRTSIQRAKMLMEAIADNLEDADSDSPEVLSLQSQIDEFVNNVLKPFYQKI
jgi:tryptophanyl-tRNA synthetase